MLQNGTKLSWKESKKELKLNRDKNTVFHLGFLKIMQLEHAREIFWFQFGGKYLEIFIWC